MLKYSVRIVVRKEYLPKESSKNEEIPHVESMRRHGGSAGGSGWDSGDLQAGNLWFVVYGDWCAFLCHLPIRHLHGHLVSAPAKRFFRRGHMMLAFDQPVVVHPKKPGDEGKIQAGHGKQIASMLLDGGAGIGAKDMTDQLAGAVFKAWMMIPITTVTPAFFSNGGDVLLKPGCKIEIRQAERVNARTCARAYLAYMDHLWTPWRFSYITGADRRARRGVPAALDAWPGDLNCVFCNLVAAVDYAIEHGMSREDAEAAGGIVVRGSNCFVSLNAYPYTSGHVMVMPYAHLDRLAKVPPDAAHEMMDLAQKTERVLDAVYRPQGFNFGLNLGEAAGAGVAGHLHLHAMPRWVGDTNFMTTVSETRVVPEDLEVTWRRLREGFAALQG